MPSIVFVAGDPSGDAHAARLIAALRSRVPDLSVYGLGGVAMHQAGAVLLGDLTTTASIGPFDASRHLASLLDAKRRLQAHLRAQPPDLAVLVDFGDFNLPVMAPMLHRLGIPIAYYISPQLWAWGRFRLRYVKRYVSRMIVFFPFEEALYRTAGVPVTWVGHPLIEQARPTMARAEALRRFTLNPARMTIGLLPGSREGELRRHLPTMLEAASRISWRMPGVQFLLPCAPGMSRERLEELEAAACASGADFELRIADGSVYDALQCMEAAIVASGTATLDCALSGVPMVVVYRTSWPTYVTARAVLRIPHIALVNVVAGRRVVPELLQYRATPRRIASALVSLVRDEERKTAMKTALREIKEKLGPPGAVDRAAAVVMDLLNTQRADASGQKSDI